jgi:hypothetical protein
MPQKDIDLWNDSGKYIVAQIRVQCNEPQARQIEKMINDGVKFLGRKLPSGVSRNMTFIQFKKYFFS